ncbi:MAG: DNA-binding protein [Bacteroidetes bacterium]|nr:DNA-binding protein [Bacteroidota bacterium]
MAIQFNEVVRGKPGVTGGGEKKKYPHIQYAGEVSADDMVKEIEKFSALSEADIKGVIIALENVIQNKLAASMIVRMDRLGYLYPTISGKGSELVGSVKSSQITRVGVRYRPGKRILDAMKAAGFEKVETNSSSPVK